LLAARNAPQLVQDCNQVLHTERHQLHCLLLYGLLLLLLLLHLLLAICLLQALCTGYFLLLLLLLLLHCILCWCHKLLQDEVEFQICATPAERACAGGKLLLLLVAKAVAAL
jgi:hypothetical protein